MIVASAVALIRSLLSELPDVLDLVLCMSMNLSTFECYPLYSFRSVDIALVFLTTARTSIRLSHPWVSHRFFAQPSYSHYVPASTCHLYVWVG